MDAYQEVGEKKYEELAPVSLSLVEKAEAMVISDDATYVEAGEIGQEVSRRIKVVKEEFEPPKSASHKAWKAVVALETKLLEPLARVKTAMSNKQGAYDLEKERKARAAEELRLAEERKKAEEEAQARAVELEQAGDKEGAAQAIEEAVDPVLAQPPMPIERAPKTEGVSHRTVWKWRYTNKKLVPDEFRDIVEKRITDRVNSMKGETNIAGVEVFEQRKTSYR